MEQFLLNEPDGPEAGKKIKKKKTLSKKSGSFDWRDWQTGELPALESHSAAKLNILRDYVERYVEILCRGVRHGSTSFRLTIVDGFAGGGIYKDGEKGSPFVIMEAIQVAEARVNEMGRNVKIKVDAHFYFADKCKLAIECLRNQIAQSGRSAEIGKTIFLVHGEFEEKHHEIVSAAKKRYRDGGRVIFFLDQCGYTQVKPSTLRAVSKALNKKAEFIINIAIEWFNDHLRDGDEFRKVFERMELGDEALFQDLLLLKKENVDWRYIIESRLGPLFWGASGCEYWSPFYIRPDQGHRGYWLLHLAPHDAARYAMASVHWKNGNDFLHYGQAGLRMLSFDPNSEKEGYFEGWAFDEWTRKSSAAKLSQQLTEQIWEKHQGGIAVGELIRRNCNDSIADQELFHQAILVAAKENQISIKGPQLGAKRSETLSDNDVIEVIRQLKWTNIWNPKE